MQNISSIRPNKNKKEFSKISDFPKTKRNEVRRLTKRGKYDRESIYKILDEDFVCHVAFNIDGQPYIIPTLYARSGDAIFIHGSSVSRMLKNLSEGIDVCVAVTLVNDLVLARSAFNHSINYRSVVVFGKGRLIEDDEEKLSALKAISDNALPERFEDSRQPTQKELNRTSVIKIEIEEASAKIREGDPVDDEKDYETNFWAGVLPIETKFGEPIADEKLDENIELPDYLKP